MILLILLLVCFPAYAFDGLVTHVIDGDTIRVNNERGEPEKIRIHYIDAPELKSTKYPYQDHGAESKTSLMQLCSGKIATINPRGTSYDRTVADVKCQDVDVAAFQVQWGYAWAYTNAPKRIKRLQIDAQGKRIGLWSKDNPIKPWEWRKGAR